MEGIVVFFGYLVQLVVLWAIAAGCYVLARGLRKQGQIAWLPLALLAGFFFLLPNWGWFPGPVIAAATCSAIGGTKLGHDLPRPAAGLYLTNIDPDFHNQKMAALLEETGFDYLEFSSAHSSRIWRITRDAPEPVRVERSIAPIRYSVTGKAHTFPLHTTVWTRRYTVAATGEVLWSHVSFRYVPVFAHDHFDCHSQPVHRGYWPTGIVASTRGAPAESSEAVATTIDVEPFVAKRFPPYRPRLTRFDLEGHRTVIAMKLTPATPADERMRLQWDEGAGSRTVVVPAFRAPHGPQPREHEVELLEARPMGGSLYLVLRRYGPYWETSTYEAATRTWRRNYLRDLWSAASPEKLMVGEGGAPLRAWAGPVIQDNRVIVRGWMVVLPKEPGAEGTVSHSFEVQYPVP